MKKLSLMILTLCTLLMFSCQDEQVSPTASIITTSKVQDVSTSARTTTKQYDKWLVKNPFIVTTYYLGGQPANDQFLPCQLDNILYFYEDGSFLELEGDLKCTASDTADIGFWAVTDSTFYLNTRNIPNTTFDILEFSSKSFKVVSQTEFIPGTGLTLGGDLDAVK